MVLLDNADLKCYRAFIQYHECSRASYSESVYMIVLCEDHHIAPQGYHNGTLRDHRSSFYRCPRVPNRPPIAAPALEMSLIPQTERGGDRSSYLVASYLSHCKSNNFNCKSFEAAGLIIGSRSSLSALSNNLAQHQTFSIYG